ncbi:MAG TPA: VOC family protein [Noviherbaspirillum sp.]|uniref:VOC family protein n=1 Tax=Noviherbaspirillum sp. TaxID=1926288 RepID=UPI002B49F17B|nr:VOC family protein [Noviherbaspirillum sp.]HJV84990.1 VOC family protein [Noviherbaspirillum sp.]
MAVIRLSYASINVTDLDKAEQHYAHVVGLRTTGTSAGRVYMQAPDSQDHHCLVLNASDRAGLCHLGFKVSAHEDLQEAADKAVAAGLKVEWMESGTLLGQGEGVVITLPSAHRINLFHESECVGYETGMRDPDLVLERVDGVNPVSHLDHALIVCSNPDQTIRFLRDVLDFNLSECGAAPDGSLFLGFLSAGNTMHQLAIGPGPDGGLHHIAFYVVDRADVVRRTDLLKHRNVPTLEYGVTRHGVAGVTTVYFFDPSGNRNEFQCGAYETSGASGRVPSISWSMESLGQATFYYEASVPEQFYTVVS